MKQSLVSQFLSFLGVGVIATACHYVVLIALVELITVAPVPASAIGALVGAIVSYFLNRNLTFASTANHSKTMPKFFVVAAFAVVMNTVLMQLFTNWLTVPYLIAQILTTVMLIAITFGFNKFWSFRP